MTEAPARAESRVALVLGNLQYQSAPKLINPPADERAISLTLEGLRFNRIVTRTELTREQMITSLRDFAREADKADWAVVYYSGYGIELAGVKRFAGPVRVSP